MSKIEHFPVCKMCSCAERPTVAHLQGVSIGRMNGTQLMVIDISAIISILGPLNSDLLSDKLLENYKHKHHHHQTNQSVHDLDSSS